jgi:hypothetical protein
LRTKRFFLQPVKPAFILQALCWSQTTPPSGSSFPQARKPTGEIGIRVADFGLDGEKLQMINVPLRNRLCTGVFVLHESLQALP